MIRHVFRLVWNRKRTTGLITLEILICFLVLCTILATSAHFLGLWQRPLGFKYDNVWYVSIWGIVFGGDSAQTAVDRQAMADILRTVGAMPEVEAVAASYNVPYSGSSWLDGIYLNGRSTALQPSITSTGLIDVFGMELINGRWLEETDAGHEIVPVVITRELAEGLYGSDDPVGRDIPRFDDEGRVLGPGEKAREDDPEPTIHRVVGVVNEYRRYGELSDRATHMMFKPLDLAAGEYIPSALMVRVQPGTTAQFEEKLVRSMQQIATSWTFDSERLESRRKRVLMGYISPVVVMGVVSVFLIIMVGLGLVGVLWLNVTRRTSELGLRRAMGASGASVRRQVLGELWALTALAVLVGTALFLQVPLLGFDLGAGDAWWGYITGVLAATLVIYTFVTLCGLYPAWLATRVQPATALQYE